MAHIASLRNWRTRAVFWCGAIAVGLIAIGFAEACTWAIHEHEVFREHFPWIAPALSPFGLALVVWLMRRFFSGSDGSGIPQAIAALELPEPSNRLRLLSLKIAFGKILLTIIGLLSGASVGREGPTVHVGASIMDALGRYVRFPYDYMRRSLVLAGSAAGLAAAFNTPLAGIIFAIEEMARSFEERTTGTLITAVLLAGVVTIAVLGDYNYFGVAHAKMPTLHGWIAVALCGVTGGLAGGLFSQCLIRSIKFLEPHYRRRPVALAFAFGLFVALLGIVSRGETYGTGYAEARGLIMHNHFLGWSFPLLKWCASMASYLTGMPGGIFSPSLATGAGLGADIAPLLHSVPASTVIVLAMAGYFTGVTQTPLTGAIIVMEMVDDHALILPMLATAFIALGVSRIVCPKPVYQALSQSYLRAPEAEEIAEGKPEIGETDKSLVKQD